MAKERQRAPWGDIAPATRRRSPTTVLFGEVWAPPGPQPSATAA